MNIILFSPEEVQLPLARSDARARHIVDVLHRHAGDEFDAGVVNGPRGKGVVREITQDSLVLAFVWQTPPPPLAPIHLLVGLPRPQTARDILREGTSLGVSKMDFIRTEKGERSYAQSALWHSSEWKNLLLAGAAQAFCTRVPEVTHGQTLAEAIAALPRDSVRLALDNYEAAESLARWPVSGKPLLAVAVGAERGWSEAERALLRAHHFTLVHLGMRVLRTETACIVAITLLQARLGLL